MSRNIPIFLKYRISVWISVKISLSVKKLCDEHSSACRATKRVVGKSYELIVVDLILAESADSNAHAAVNITVELCLGTIILLKVGDELLGRVRESDRKSVV